MDRNRLVLQREELKLINYLAVVSVARNYSRVLCIVSSVRSSKLLLLLLLCLSQSASMYLDLLMHVQVCRFTSHPDELFNPQHNFTL